MLIGNVYKEIVQSPQNWTKRSTCKYKDEGGFVDVILIMNQNLEKIFKPLSMVPKGTVDV